MDRSSKSMEHSVEDASGVVDFETEEVSDETDVSDSEIDDYELKFYLQLKSGERKVKFADNIYKCPFCVGKKKRTYFFKDLLQHAVGVGASNRSGRERASHYALERFMKNDLPVSEDIESRPTAVDRVPLLEPKHVDRLVWPWMGILINDCETGSRLRSRLRDQFTEFHVLKFRYLQDSKNSTAILEFGKDWEGLKNALAFECYFESKHSGRKEWLETGDHAREMYGWVARADDYDLYGLVGEHLRSKGDLKTVIDLAEEESCKNKKLVEHLTREIALKNKCLEELELKCFENAGVHENSRNSKLEKGSMICQICNEPNHSALYCGHRFDQAYQAADISQDLAALHLSQT